jgi:hypothetical protein
VWILIWGSALLIVSSVVVWLELRNIVYQARIGRLLSQRTFKVSLWTISDGLRRSSGMGRGWSHTR